MHTTEPSLSLSLPLPLPLSASLHAFINSRILSDDMFLTSAQAEELLSLDEENRKMFEAVRGNDALQVRAAQLSATSLSATTMFLRKSMAFQFAWRRRRCLHEWMHVVDNSRV
jgi:hypothetical protein